MKYIVILLLFVAQYSSATTYYFEGKVDFVRTHNAKIMGKNNDWIAVQGVSSAGSCRAWDGHVVLRITKKMDRAYTAALQAQMAGKTVQVSVDDANQDESGACFLRWINIKN